jgi:hypothetical protein
MELPQQLGLEGSYEHYVHASLPTIVVSTVDDICPSVNNTTLTVNYGLVKMETI